MRPQRMAAVIDAPTVMAGAREEILRRAAALAAEFRARAAEAEANRTMPADLAAKVKKAGLFRLSLPSALGGWEADPFTIFEAIDQLSYADGSAGWTVLIGCSPVFMAWLDPAVRRTSLGRKPRHLHDRRVRPSRPGRL